MFTAITSFLFLSSMITIKYLNHSFIYYCFSLSLTQALCVYNDVMCEVKLRKLNNKIKIETIGHI